MTQAVYVYDLEWVISENLEGNKCDLTSFRVLTYGRFRQNVVHTSIESATRHGQIIINTSLYANDHTMLKTPVLVRSPKSSNMWARLVLGWNFIRGVKLTTHLRLVSRLKNGWGCTSTPPIRLHGVVLS